MALKFILLIKPITCPFLLRKLRNYLLITESQLLRQTNMSPKYYFRTLPKQQFKRTLKPLRLTSFCPSFSPFVLTVLFISSSQVVNSYFYVSLNLVAVSTV